MERTHKERQCKHLLRRPNSKPSLEPNAHSWLVLANKIFADKDAGQSARNEWLLLPPGDGYPRPRDALCESDQFQS